MKPLMASPSKPRTTLPAPSNLNSLLSIICALFLTTPNLTSAIAILPPCAESCYISALSGSFGCIAGDIQCFCNPPGSTNYFNCVKGVCDTAGQQEFEQYGEQNCGIYGFSANLGSLASATTATAGGGGGATTLTSVVTGNAGGATATGSSFENIEPTAAASTSSSAAAANTNPGFFLPANTAASGATATTTTVIIQQGSGQGSSSGGGSGGLSTGAKAGIGAGAGVAGAVILCLVAVFGWKLGQGKKKRQAAAAGVTGAGGNGNIGRVSGSANYVPPAWGEGAATWTKIEANTTDAELEDPHSTGHYGSEGGGHGEHALPTML